MAESFVSIALRGDLSEAEGSTHQLAFFSINRAVSRPDINFIFQFISDTLCFLKLLPGSWSVFMCLSVWVCGMYFRLCARSIK